MLLSRGLQTSSIQEINFRFCVSLFLYHQSNLTILRDMAVLIAQNFKSNPERGNIFSLHKQVNISIPALDYNIFPLDIMSVAFKIVMLCFFITLSYSKDGDNEFMNIIANEIGFEVRYV